MPGWVSSKVSQEPNRYQVLVKTWIPQGIFSTMEQAQQFYEAKWEGKIDPADWRTDRFAFEKLDQFTFLVNIWTVRAEFVTADECELWAEDNLADFQGEWNLAMRNSLEAAALLEYGTKKMGRLDAIRALKEERAQAGTEES